MIDYKLIKELDKNPAHTQRSLAKKFNISLGKLNYVLSGLVQKGLVKAKRIKDHPDKVRWHYVLTPKGIQEKVLIAKRYLVARMTEFDRLKVEIHELKEEVGGDIERIKK